MVNLSPDWNKTTLGEHVDIQTGFPFKSQNYTQDGIRLLRGDNIVQGSLRWDGVKRWPAIDGEKFQNYFLQAGDVVLAMDRPWIEAGLKYAWITERDLPCLLVQRVSRIRGVNGLRTSFLRYVIGHQSFADYVKGIWTGVAVPHISESQIRGFPFALPPTAIQERIERILLPYDDLIENNTRRIKLLEEMAQMIYREWFVKFRFPGHENVKMAKSKLGEAPTGWCQSFADYVDFLEGPGLRRWQYRDSGLRFLNIRTIGDGDIDVTKAQFVDPVEAEAKYKHFFLSEYDHVVSSSGTIGRIVTVRREHLPIMLNTSVIRMRPKSECVGRWQLKHFLKSEYFQKQTRAFASGVAQMNFGPSHLKQMEIIAPPEKIGAAYESIVTAIEVLICNLTQSKTVLRRTRDLLLPKLISGEMNVEHFEPEFAAQTI